MGFQAVKLLYSKQLFQFRSTKRSSRNMWVLLWHLKFRGVVFAKMSEPCPALFPKEGAHDLGELCKYGYNCKANGREWGSHLSSSPNPRTNKQQINVDFPQPQTP